ncbi:uncharacterized protein SCHCODRAFT_02617879 [Schizophyllum commune H4-8]|uniref:uncharacterized protein n=1 Tax=Schizophyllum commune (strain H4-8 / FGSC 9210) TaxID=578458 RepID=UPI0021602E66|nr:uncharacterized protein SCHCODRAFT_02617879 [Schizophyllum commune H4-8]KAI5894837.1 hypothetical protein SCHCODRAFT_02617879 [Schizophyllum commune H4-8]
MFFRTQKFLFLLVTCLPGRQVLQMPRCLDEYSDVEMDVFVTTVGRWLEQLRAMGPSPYTAASSTPGNQVNGGTAAIYLLGAVS